MIKMRVKNLLKGILYAIVSAVIFLALPFIIQMVTQYFPSVAVDSPILRWIEVIGVGIVVVAFFVGLFQSKTIKHAVAGLVEAVLIAMYIVAFSVIRVSFSSINITLDISVLLLLPLLIDLLISLGYVVELIQAIRLRGKTVSAPMLESVKKV
jgi:hypothetical protein